MIGSKFASNKKSSTGKEQVVRGCGVYGSLLPVGGTFDKIKIVQGGKLLLVNRSSSKKKKKRHLKSEFFPGALYGVTTSTLL